MQHVDTTVAGPAVLSVEFEGWGDRPHDRPNYTRRAPLAVAAPGGVNVRYELDGWVMLVAVGTGGDVTIHRWRGDSRETETEVWAGTISG